MSDATPTPPAVQNVSNLGYTASASDKVINLTGLADGQNEGSEVSDKINASAATPPQGESETYNADKARDSTRQTITLWLVGLLCSIVALSFAALFASGAATAFSDPQFFENFKKILDVILPPVTTLLASTVGFYFGYKQGELITTDNSKSPPGTKP